MNDRSSPSDAFLPLLDALCDETLTESQSFELAEILQSNTAARKKLIDHVQLQIDIQFLCQAKKTCDDGLCRVKAMLPGTMSSIPPGVVLPPVAYSESIGFLASGWPAAYLMATVIVGFGLTLGALIRAPQPSQIVLPSFSCVSGTVGAGGAKGAGGANSSKSDTIGRITGMVDCDWEGSEFRAQGSGNGNRPSASRSLKADVALGDRIALRSGLLEVTYDTGARVILQGPVTYQVDSATGGYLSVGKLTARLEKKSEVPANPKSEIRNQKLFTVTTPTAIVTDLGTEFGVDVQKSGMCQTHVFQGKVEVRVTNPEKGSPCAVQLAENESAQVRPAAGDQTVVRRVNVAAGQFVRQLPNSDVLLFADNFNCSGGTNDDVSNQGCGLNQGLEGRQSGASGRVQYIARGPNADLFRVGHPVDGRGMLNLYADFGQEGLVVLNRNFPRDITVSVDLHPLWKHWPDRAVPAKFVENDRTSENWLAIGIRGRGTWFEDLSIERSTDSGLVFVMCANGMWRYVENGKEVSLGRVPAAIVYRTVISVFGDRVKIEVNGTGVDLDHSGHSSAHILRGFVAVTKDNFITLATTNTDPAAGPQGRNVSCVGNLRVFRPALGRKSSERDDKNRQQR